MYNSNIHAQIEVFNIFAIKVKLIIFASWQSITYTFMSMINNLNVLIYNDMRKDLPALCKIMTQCKVAKLLNNLKMKNLKVAL